MERLPRLLIVGGLATASVWTSIAQAPQIEDGKPAANATRAAADLPSLPPLPSGKSTILGGEIRDIDPVLDRFMLRVFGDKPVRILYDERTQVFVDGKRIPLRDLKPSEHASIQTTLEGANVFAISIHILSQATPGNYQGQVLSFNRATGELAVGGASNPRPFTLLVSENAIFVREGQGAFASTPSGPSDLQPGTLVSINFDSDNKGHGVASHIAILATPGARFIFSGNLIAIDMHTNLLVLVDPRDDRRYQIVFNASNLPVTQNLRVGQHVRVAAEYDGTNYQAREITASEGK